MSSFILLCHLRCLSTTTAAATTVNIAISSSLISISKAKSKLRIEHDPNKALEIYSSVSKHYSSPSSSRYTQDLTACRLAKSHHFFDIDSMIESDKNDPKISQEPFLSTLIRSYGIVAATTVNIAISSSLISISKAKSKLCIKHDPDKALEIYSSVSKHYSSPSSSRYTQDLTACRLAKSHHFFDIDSMIESDKNDPKISQEPFLSTLIRSYGIVATTVNIAISSSLISISKAKSKLRIEHDLDKALEIYSSVSKHYSSPSSSRYTQDLTACRLAKSHHFFDIDSMIESDKNDPKISQEPFLSTLIRSYGIVAATTVNIAISSSLISISKAKSKLRIEHDPDKALEIYSSVSKHYSSPSSSRYTQDLTACRLAKSHRFFDIDSLIESDKNDPKISQEPFLSTLIRSYGIVGFKRNGKEKCGGNYTIILNDLYKKGKIEEAEKLWTEMMKTGCELDVASYNVRISNFQGGEPEKVKELIDDMSGLGLNQIPLVIIIWISDFNTLKHLTEGLVRNKKFKEAKGLIRTVKNKFPPNFLNVWKKLVKELGLVSGASNDEAQEA
ncbi:hypothetical protein REPUB_Repub17cG0001100 [Reevesia pubescens]